jgi:RNA polymerase sigma-70 factor (ECF subfamily)
LDLEAAITVAAEAGHAAWTGVELPPEVFASHVRETRARAADVVQHGADLYLACATARGDAAALRILERRLVPRLAGQVRRIGVPAANVEDVLQNMLIEVVGGPRPRIAHYSGRGALLRWLRVVAIRTALTSLRRADVPTVGDALLSDLAATGDDPEIGTLKRRFSAELQQALEEALAQLPRRSKTVLRMHYLDGLNIEAIGAVYHVHRATVARWLISIRTEIATSVRKRFALAPRPTSSDFRSLTIALQEELHISIDRVLGSGRRTG